MIEFIFDEGYSLADDDLRSLETAGKIALEMQGVPKCAASVFFTGDKKISELNKAYRNIDKPTDVLSFPTREGMHMPSADNFLGDIVISLETAAWQADEIGQSLLKELDFLVIHGILHLLGFDHVDRDDEITMLERQREILDRIDKCAFRG